MISKNVVSVVCFVHNQHFPRGSCEVHHEAPRAAGGTDKNENLVWLCANCHSLAHRCAQLYLKNKKGIADDMAMQAYHNPGVRQRFMQVVKEITNATTLAEDFDLGKDKAVCMVPLDHDTYEKLKLLAYEKREKGRKVGVSRYVEVLILTHLRQKGLLS